MKATLKNKKSVPAQEVLIPLAPKEKRALDRRAEKVGLTSAELVNMALNHFTMETRLFLNANQRNNPARRVE